MGLSVVAGDICRTVAILLVGASVVRSGQVMRLYYGVMRELDDDQRALRLLPRHVWKVSLAYLGLCVGLALVHAYAFGRPWHPVFLIDIPIFVLGLSAINDVYRFQRRRQLYLDQKRAAPDPLRRRVDPPS